MSSVETSDLKPAMKRPPEDVEVASGYVAAEDGEDLYWHGWESAAGGEVHAVVALMHGFAEHVNRYHHVASYLVRAGYGVVGLDIRGHGRSTGPRGYVDDFVKFPSDFEQLVRQAEACFPGVPVVSLAHSNGGLVALHHALRYPGRVEAYAVTSPFTGFAVKVPPIKALAGNLLSRAWGRFALPTDLDASHLTHIDEVVEAYESDPLVFDVATARWFTETKQAQAELLERASEIASPVLFLIAGADELADPQSAEDVYHRLGSANRELEVLPDLYHEILNETDWAERMEDVVDWFERHARD